MLLVTTKIDYVFNKQLPKNYYGIKKNSTLKEEWF